MSEIAEKRPVGRPKGQPKTGGRVKGSGNRLPAELRDFINARGKPVEFLAAIASGRKVSAADPEDPSKKVRVYPNLDQRAKASEMLLNRLLPALKATQLSGPEGGPIEVSGGGVPDLSTFETARRLAFIIRSAHEEQNHQAEAAQRSVAADDAPPSQPPAPPSPPTPKSGDDGPPQIGDTVAACGATLTLA